MTGERLTLKIALGTYPHTAPLKDGRVTSERLALEFVEFKAIPRAFRAMVREDELDASEMAICTHLQAVHFGKGFAGLAVPLVSQRPLDRLVCATDRPVGPSDLPGRRIGTRSYTQTTGVWIRGLLEDIYGIDCAQAVWVTEEDSHVPEYDDPPCAEANAAPGSTAERLLAGDLAAAVGAAGADPGSVRPVVEDAAGVFADYHARTGILPINHTVSIRGHLVERHDWLAPDLMRMFEEARRIAGDAGESVPAAYGRDANRTTLQAGFDHAARQKLTPRRYDIDEAYLDL